MVALQVARGTVPADGGAAAEITSQSRGEQHEPERVAARRAAQRGREEAERRERRERDRRRAVAQDEQRERRDKVVARQSGRAANEPEQPAFKAAQQRFGAEAPKARERDEHERERAAALGEHAELGEPARAERGGASVPCCT